jgi:hypothetical protein
MWRFGFFLLLSGLVLANDCPKGFDDCFDLGNITSMSYRNAIGFGVRDIDKYSVGTVWEPISGICGNNYENAVFLGIPDSQAGFWKKVTIRYYDSPSNLDSFRVYITWDNLLATVNDKNDGIGT